jgi:hypothetical protein
MNRLIMFAISLFVFVWLSFQAHAFKSASTHRQLTEAATKPSVSNLDNYIITNLGFSEGIGKIYNGLDRRDNQQSYSIAIWLVEGVKDEDDLNFCRASNHFHDPTHSDWSQSQMSDSGWVDLFCGTGKRYSNVTWATGFTAPGGTYTADRIGQYLGMTGLYDVHQDMGWDSARGYYYDALVATDPVIREAKFINTFRAMGQTLHLLQDMAVPAHTRNDMESHLFNTANPLEWFTKWFSNPFEKYVADNYVAISNTSGKPTLTAQVMLTDFWDTVHRTGAPFEGLAEYSNANFFSDSTIPTNGPSTAHLFPNPQISSANYICTDKLPGSNKPTKYVSRTQCPTSAGSVDHFVAVSLVNSESDSASASSIKETWLDNNVHDTYAKDILPRTVGYSAALLDHFFRGSIELSLPTQGVYATATPGGAFNEIRVRAKNITATGEEMSNGTIQLVVKYNLSLADPYQSVLVDLGPDTYIVVPEKNVASAISTTTPTELVFDLSASALPIWAANVSIQLVFKGNLGNETDSVAVGFKDISEPTPIDVYNNTDYSCLNGSWYRYDDPAAMAIVDSNGDGIADRSDIYPHKISDIAFLGGPANAGTLNAAASNNLFAAGPLQPGQVLRMGYILTDYSSRFAINEIRTGLYGDPFTHATGDNRNYPGTGFLNNWETQNSMFSFLGHNMWWGTGVIFINTEYNGTCTWDALNQLLGF